MFSEQTTWRSYIAKQSTWISVVVNLMLTALQLIVGWVAQSQALMADGVHSLSDLIADGVVLFALQHSHKAPDDDHHYGHLRYENAASLALSALLIAAGLGMAWAAGAKLLSAQSIAPVNVAALWVALIAVACKEGLFRYMLRVANQLQSSLLVANAWHARSDAVSSLVVAIGIGGSLLGLRWLDPLAAAVVAVMIINMGWGFLRSAFHDLTDHAVPEEQIEQIRATLLGVPGVQGIHDLRTRKTGDMMLVDVHIEIDGNLSVKDGHAIADRAQKTVMQAHRVMSVMTHVDPV